MKFAQKNTILSGIALAAFIAIGVAVWFTHPRVQVAKLRAEIQKGENAKDILPVIDEYAKKLFDGDKTNDPASTTLLGVYASNAGDKRLALWFYGRTLSREPNNPSSINNTAVVYEELKEYDRAEEYRMRYLKLYPVEIQGYRALADLYRYRFDNAEDKIVSLMNDGFVKTGDHPDLLTWMISYYQERGQPQKALPYSQKLLKKIPAAGQK